jgi:hypothetical protein
LHATAGLNAHLEDVDDGRAAQAALITIAPVRAGRAVGNPAAENPTEPLNLDSRGLIDAILSG